MDNSFVKKHLADCVKDAKRQKDKRAMHLDGNGGWGLCVIVHNVACEDVFGGGSDPGSD